MPSSEIPPKRRDEINEFFSQVVRTGIEKLLADGFSGTRRPGAEAREPQEGRAQDVQMDGTQGVQQGRAQGVDADAGGAARGPTPQSADVAVADEVQQVPNEEFPCCYCYAQKPRKRNTPLVPNEQDLKWLNSKLQHSFAISLAVQQYHST